MRFIFIFLFITSLLFSYIESISYGKYISIQEAPYFVSLVHPRNVHFYTCGGSIISEYWIVTAAHCFDGDELSDEPTQAVFAGKSINGELSTSTIYLIRKIFIHAGYHRGYSTSENDIALIKLKWPIAFNQFSQPIKIRKIPPRENDTVVVMGFGLQGDTKGQADILRQSEVAVVAETICKDYATHSYPNLNVTVKTVFCAGNGTTDVCQGDSGGPAVIDRELAGLVSFGPPCSNYADHTHNPGAYTRLDLFYEWIVEITGIVF